MQQHEYQRRLKQVEIRLSNDETFKGDIIEDENGDVVLRTSKGEIFRIPRGAISHIREY